VAVLPGGRYALTANHTADSVSLVDLEAGKVVRELACGRRPAAVACSADGRRAAVSNLWSGTVTLFAVRGDELERVGDVEVGAFPRGLAFSPAGDCLFAAVAGNHEVVQIDANARRVTHRWPAPREPRHLAVSADGRWLAAASTRTAQVRCWDLRTQALHWERTIEDAFNLRGLAFAPDGRSVLCAHVVRREFPVSRENIEQGWVIDSRLTRLALDADVRPASWQIALDTRGRAVGDPHGLTFDAGGRTLAVTGSGTHELLLMDAESLPWNAGDPGDFLNPRLAGGEHPLRRVPLGGRPLAVAFAAEGTRAVVANHLLDAVQVVDTAEGNVVRSIPLGAPAMPSLERRGEALFYDAQRSHHQWFSCHTCHVEGHTCGLTFDTLNDDSYGNPKLTPTLRHVTQTGPWTWHGWQKDLGASVEKSLTQTMFGPKPTAEETRALVAFLGTLDDPPRPLSMTRRLDPEAVERGKALFREKARCARCHKGEYYTSESNYDVHLEPDGSPYRLWNPPSLLGLSDRDRYLHDGRARSLEEVLHKHHTPEMLGGQALTEQESQDLLIFLRSL
jgi:DNA-binding beta-propeller fold protein YncE